MCYTFRGFGASYLEDDGVEIINIISAGDRGVVFGSTRCLLGHYQSGFIGSFRGGMIRALVELITECLPNGDL